MTKFADLAKLVMMIKVNIHEAKTPLSSFIAAVEERGEIICICRNGKPVAELRPIEVRYNPFQQDPQLKGIFFLEDPVTALHVDDWPDSA